jgi:hypothetical protein
MAKGRAKKAPATSVREDGGYYAIKGFLFQFDKTIIELITLPDSEVEIESNEDIATEDYWIQVKHKETQDYAPHKIKKPICQLLSSFNQSASIKLRLYCYFRDRAPQEEILDKSGLDIILGDDKNKYNDQVKDAFLSRFILEFAEDFESQFQNALVLIQTAFNLPDRQSAIYFHALIRSFLLDLARTKDKAKRVTSLSGLKRLARKATSCITLMGYQSLLDEQEYERIVRSNIFTFKNANINDFERLFVIDGDVDCDVTDIIEIVNLVSRKYFVPDKSPPPYICLRNFSDVQVVEAKRKLWDKGIFFNDGTHFAMDRFRWDSLLQRQDRFPATRVRIIDNVHITDPDYLAVLDEVFHLYVDRPVALDTYHKRQFLIPINGLDQALRIFRK